MIGQLIIEHGIPMPPPPAPRDPDGCVFCGKRPRVEPYKTCDECRDWSKRRHEERKAAGLCAMSPCPSPSKEGHTMCAQHLQKMLDYSNERRDQRKKAKVCINCGDRPQWFGLRCVVCRSVDTKDGSLPNGARRAIKKYRRNEAIAERRRVAIQARELLEGRAREVVSLRHGLVDGSDWSLEEIGQKFGCTRERIRQIEDRAYDDLSTTSLNLDLLRPPYQRQRRPTAVKISAYESKKRKAHQLVAKALQAGTLTRKPCQECGDLNSIGHHHKGYDFPLEVEWLCLHHHVIAHGRNKTGEYKGSQKRNQPPAWLSTIQTASNPRIVALLGRMMRYRPRLKQKQIIADTGLHYQQMMNALRGFSNDEPCLALLEIYIGRLEQERSQIAA